MYYDKHNATNKELYNLCEKICDKKNTTAIYHALSIRGIKSIDDLRECDLSDIRKFRCIGEVRFEFIKQMKAEISNSKD